MHKTMRSEIDHIVELAEAEDPFSNLDEIEDRFEFLWNFVEEHNEGEEAHVFPTLNVLSCNISEPFIWDHNEERETFEETRDLVRRVKATRDTADMQRLRSNLIGLRTSLHTHSKKEDQILLPMLFEGASPQEQGEMVGRIVDPKPPEQLMQELAWFMPSLTMDERADFLTVIKQGMDMNAPPGAFDAAMDTVSMVVSKEEMDELRSRLTSVQAPTQG